jgi:hypothetical protein
MKKPSKKESFNYNKVEREIIDVFHNNHLSDHEILDVLATMHDELYTNLYDKYKE